MASFTVTWSSPAGFEGTPAGTVAANTLDERIQELKVAIRERTEIEHYWAGDGFDGVHKLPYLAVASRDALTDKTGQVVLSSDGARISYNNGSSWVDVESFAIGDVKIGAYTTPTYGWLLCNGSSLLRAGTYADLFGVISTLYGTADGTHFNIPDMQGKVPAGLNSSDTDFDALGDAPGALTVALSEAELAAHTHVFTGDAVGNHTHNYKNPSFPIAGAGSTWQHSAAGWDGTLEASASGGGHTPTGTNASTGSGTAHANVQPSLVFNYFIKYL